MASRALLHFVRARRRVVVRRARMSAHVSVVSDQRSAQLSAEPKIVHRADRT
jgi:hypothetical protein